MSFEKLPQEKGLNLQETIKHIWDVGQLLGLTEKRLRNIIATQ